jgi:hypothetical protein
MIIGNSGLKRKFHSSQTGEASNSSTLTPEEVFLTSYDPGNSSVHNNTKSNKSFKSTVKMETENQVIDLTASPPSRISAAGPEPDQVYIDLTADSPPPEDTNEEDHVMAMELQAQYLDGYNEANNFGPADMFVPPEPMWPKHDAPDSSAFHAAHQNLADCASAEFQQLTDYASGLDELPDCSLTESKSFLADFKLAESLQKKYDEENGLSGSTDSSIPMEKEVEQSRTLLFEYGQKVSSVRCSSCRKSLFHGESGIRNLNKIAREKKRQSSVHECPFCRTPNCIGCGKLVDKKTQLNRKNIDGREISWCCDDGRLFIIWRLLCEFKGLQPRLSNAPRLLSSFRQSSSLGKKSGIGYGDMQRNARRKAEPLLNLVEQDPKDAEMSELLSVITSLLPDWQNQTAFDNDPPPILRAMFRRSALINRVAEVLRNDSIESVGYRVQVYGEAIRFVSVLAHHPLTARMCYEERVSYLHHDSLLPVTLGPRPRYPSRRLPPTDTVPEKAQSLDAVMQPLQLQAQAYTKQARALVDLVGDDIPPTLLNLCETIVELASFLKANAPAEPEKEKAPTTVNLTEWHKEHCLDDIPDDEILDAHHYKQQAKDLNVSHKGRMKRLMTELATLKTSLPEGIYLRHGTSRLDLMKVLIVGPKDTPYENGLFEFDIYCPGNYPNEPPKVHFKTTGGGAAHFNPNLYPEGKGLFQPLSTHE